MKLKSLGYVAFLFLIIPFFYYVLENLNINVLNSWEASDWLISYSGGFVRRGLSGEIIYKLTDFFSVSPAKLIVLITTSLYVSCVIIFIKISKNIIPLYILLHIILYNYFTFEFELINIIITKIYNR